jgi:adenylate cyclase
MRSSRRLPPLVAETCWFGAIGAVFGTGYGHLRAVQDGAPLLCLAGVPRGVITGLVIGILFALERASRRPALTRLTSTPFLVHLAVKTAIYLAIIQFGLVVGARLFPSPREAGIALPIDGTDLLVSCAMVLAVGFVDDIDRLLGQNVLLDFIIGRYYRPRQEERVFLFIDIEGSTALAERLGELAFHRLVNRFVVDITAPIVAARGRIHRYVGDEVIATWKLADGIADAHCVRGCFAALERLAASAPTYRRDFGAALNCRAGLHCGPVVAGEMGSVKKEIVFLGDTVNTAARILEFCRQSGDRVLASSALVDRLELPAGITKRALGDLRLRGKERDVALYALAQEPGGAAGITLRGRLVRPVDQVQERAKDRAAAQADGAEIGVGSVAHLP